MTPEEFQRIKDAEKEHLRSLKKLKQAVRNLERQKKVTGAVENISKTESLIDEHDSLVEKLAIETAHNEARLEVALESAAEKESIERAEEARARLDVDMQKIRAKNLVNQLKGEISEPAGSTRSESHSDKASDTDVTNESPETDQPKLDLPEKTIGRMRRK